MLGKGTGLWCTVCDKARGSQGHRQGLGTSFNTRAFLHIRMEVCERSGQDADNQIPARTRGRATSGSGGDKQDGVELGKTQNIRTATEDGMIGPVKNVCCAGNIW